MWLKQSWDEEVKETLFQIDKKKIQAKFLAREENERIWKQE